MSWSLGEIQALTIKAARGAGFPWGVADEAGWAVRWLASFGLPGPEAMAKTLTSPDADRCPLTLGIAVADRQDPLFANGGSINQPLILLPFLARAAGSEQAFVQINQLTFNVAQNGTDLTVQLPEDGQLTVSIVERTIADRPPVHRIEAISSEALATLQTLAQKTYAPATEASRISGAGAGLTDND